MMGGPFGGGPLAGIKWQIDQCVEMGGSVICGGFGFPSDEKSKAEIRDYLQQKGVEFEFYTFGWQGLLGPDAAGAKDQMLKSFAESKYYGNYIVRSAYNGRLRYEFSRFNKARPIKEHMKEVTNILKAAKPIFEGEGMTLAIENHCDFTAKEWAEIFTELNSPNIGCGYDTANDYTVYADPNEQVEYIAPFVVSTHMKDMACTQYWTADRDLIPYQARGTALGDGNVDIPKMIDEFDKKSPKAEGLRLIIEQGWMDIPMGVNPAELHAQYLRQGMKYLNSLVH
jgi:sugar phosphate isomerase/epimerase